MAEENAKKDYIELNIHHTLTLDEAMSYIHGVVASCFDDETGEYLPELQAFASRVYFVKCYGGAEIPEDNSERYRIAYDAGLFETIYKQINADQFKEINDAINRKVEHIADSKISILQMGINKNLSELTAIGEKLNGLFEGVDTESMNKMIHAFGDNEFSAEKIVEAYKKNGKD